ncbi:hypothetical protein ABL78_4801 [Leptomonas seymouri]|uniref:CCHC-type domain-containing protein n=1 Tax=Leptomonas seymouri TaxID=5684 RepID=A0A0N0P578_LEPSE|nr:hypothetical protein ABL78_4801 [Leptomonas seymouri]|eukprot:KPI86146.1 hypothetical protein ABL78_4801 [Leptomonas seymouri]
MSRAMVSTRHIPTAAPSFLVYPLPSIADETFLQLIFRRKVLRSLFFGFGRGRLAIVELNDAATAHEVEKLLKEGASVDQGVPARPDAAATKKRAEKQEEVAENVEDLTLADMFAAPATDSGTIDAAPSTAALEQLSDSGDLSHLPFLVYGGRPVHVVVSGVRVSDFYGSGGVVPEKHESKEDRSSSRKKSKREGAAGGKRTRDVDSEPQQPSLAGGSAAAVDAVTPKYPKSACQRCGSRDHFTRHCDGSGVAAAAAPATTTTTEATAETTTDKSGATASPTPRPSLTSLAPTQKKFTKDCCQKCGSPNHFTRHCDGSGAMAPAADVSPDKRPRVDEAPPLSSAAAKEIEAVTATDAAKRKPAVIQRTSKDQCKHCGSDAHLSRHCPGK